MAIADIKFGDAFGSWAIGAAMGALGIYILMNVKGISTTAGDIKRSNMARAYPSYFWDLRDPGATQANFDEKYYPYNGIPVDGMFNGVDFDATNLRFSALGGYEAPKNL